MNIRIADRVFRILLTFLFILGMLGRPASRAMAQPSSAPGNPWLEIWVPEDRIQVVDWPLDTTVTVTIDSDFDVQNGVLFEHNYERGNEERLQIELAEIFDIQPGQVITVADASFTRFHQVTEMKVTGWDIGLDRVYGTARPNSSLQMHARNPDTDWAWRSTTTDDLGNWVLDFSQPGTNPGEQGLLDIKRGTSGAATQPGLLSGEGGQTHYAFYVANPQITAFPYYYTSFPNNQVYGSDWQPGTTVTLRIDDPTNGPGWDYTDSQTAPSIDQGCWPDIQLCFNIDPALFKLQPGQFIRLSNGAVTKEHTVTNLRILWVDYDADTVGGTAQAGSQVMIWGHHQNPTGWLGRSVTTDPAGNWKADYSIPEFMGNDTVFDFQPGDFFISQQYDQDGDMTRIWWQPPNPGLSVVPNNLYSDASNIILGWDWEAGKTVTLCIENPPFDAECDYSDSLIVPINPEGFENHQFQFSIDPAEFQIMSGQRVKLDDGVHTEQHIVTNMQLTWVSWKTDTVSGTADPGSLTAVVAQGDSGSARRWVTADGNGNWSADFAHPGSGPDEQDILDLRAGHVAFIPEQMDENGNSTKFWYFWWEPHNPAFSVVPDDPNGGPNNIILGWAWEPGTTLGLCIENPPFDSVCDYADSQIVPAEPNGFVDYQLEFDVDPSVFKISGGQRVQLDNGLYTAEHIVTNLRLTWVDWESDTIGGTADAGSEVIIWALQQDPEGGAKRIVTADGSGNWAASFGIAGSERDEQDTLDLRLGQAFFIPEQTDEYGNSTRFWWQPPNPSFGVRPADDSIEGWQWPLGSTITIEIDDPSTLDRNPDFTAQTDSYVPDWNPNELRFDLYFQGEYDLKPGDIVKVSNGSTIKTHVAGNMTIDEINPNSDMVFGHGSPGRQVDVWACWENTCVNRKETPDQAGNWQVDFSKTGTQDWEQETLDIRPGAWVDSSQTDEDGDGTKSGRVAGSTLLGTVYLLESAPENAMSGVMVEACTADNYCRTALTDGSGSYWLGGLPEGIYNIRAIPPGSNLPASIGPVELSYDEMLYGQDVIVSEPPLPPPPDAVEPAHAGGGTLSVYWMDDLTLTVHGCANGAAAFKLTVLEDGYSVSGSMTETPAGPGTYAAGMPALYPHHGVAWIEFSIACPGGDIENPAPFPIYIDPSGVIKDTGGEPVSGATVTLFHSDSPDGPFIEVPDGSVLMSPSNRSNPDITDASGQFGWDVVAGFYKVRAEKTGCFSPTDPTQSYVESAILTIPPPVTGLELVLQCPQAPSAEAGGPYTVPWGAELTLDGSGSSDPDDTIASYEWDLDGDGLYDDASGATPTTTFHQTGPLLIGLRVTDERGSRDTDTAVVTVLAWTLKGFQQPVDMNGVYNVVRGGSTVPLKFEIFAGPTELTDLTDVKSLTYVETACNANAVTDEVELTVTGGTGLRYDTLAGQYVYNWRTPKVPGNCYRVTMVSLDGSALLAYFKIK